MFGINLNFTSKDVGMMVALPVAIGGVALATKFAYNYFNGKSIPSVSTNNARSLAEMAVVAGGAGAAIGMVSAYFTGAPMQKEGLKAAGYGLGTVVVLATAKDFKTIKLPSIDNNG